MIKYSSLSNLCAAAQNFNVKPSSYEMIKITNNTSMSPSLDIWSLAYGQSLPVSLLNLRYALLLNNGTLLFHLHAQATHTQTHTHGLQFLR
jgi:hypothetical protein